MSTNFKAFYKSPWGVAFIAYFVAMGLVGALTPQDILTAYSWTRPFTDFMASIVPQIDKVTALGIDPDINRFYFSVMWAGSPVLVLIFALIAWRDRDGHMLMLTYYRQPFSKMARTLGVLVLMVIFTYHIEWVTYSKSKLTLGTFGTNLGRFALPQVFATGTTLLCLPFFSWLVISFFDIAKQTIKKKNKLENKRDK